SVFRTTGSTFGSLGSLIWSRNVHATARADSARRRLLTVPGMRLSGAPTSEAQVAALFASGERLAQGTNSLGGSFLTSLSLSLSFLGSSSFFSASLSLSLSLLAGGQIRFCSHIQPTRIARQIRINNRKLDLDSIAFHR